MHEITSVIGGFKQSRVADTKGLNKADSQMLIVTEPEKFMSDLKDQMQKAHGSSEFSYQTKQALKELK